MSEEKPKSRKMDRFLKVIEQLRQIGKKVAAHPQTKAILSQIWAHRLKIGLILLVILLVGTVVGVIVNNRKTPDEVVEEFQRAIVNKDAEKLQDLVEPYDDQLTFGQREAYDLIRFAEKDDDFFADEDGVMQILRSQAAAYRSGLVDIFSDKDLIRGPYYLQKERGLFGDTYSIGVLSRYLVIQTDQPGVTVILDGKEMKMKGKKMKIGPLLPKRMQIKGVKKTAYSVVEDEDEVNLIDSSDEVVQEYLHLEGEKIKITSVIPETELLINGKKTGKQVGPDGIEFGPISLNGQYKLSGQKKVPWGIIKSKEQVVNGSSDFDITPNPFLDETTKKQLIQTINTYAQERVKALKQVSTKPYTTIDPQFKQKLEDDFERDRKFSTGEQYKGEAIKTVIAVQQGSVYYSQKFNLLKVKVPVQFHYRERTYHKNDRKDEPLMQNVEEAYVFFIYDEKQKKWLITELNRMYYIEDMFRDPSCVITKFSQS